jgi:hypothetical protein
MQRCHRPPPRLAILSFHARHAADDVTVMALHPDVLRTSMVGLAAPFAFDTCVRGVAEVIEDGWGWWVQAFVDYRDTIIRLLHRRASMTAAP